MDPEYIINELSRNKEVYRHFLTGATSEEYNWKPAPDKWCLLEIVCHLYDEEREDFRARVKSVLENPELALAPIDPVGWVQSRGYMQQDFNSRLNDFLKERDNSLDWLRTLRDADWNRTHDHPKLGPLSAGRFLANWLAHDLLHFRQISKTKYLYLKYISNEDLSYAGELL